MPTELRGRKRTDAAWATPKRCLLAVLVMFISMVAIGSIPGNADALSAMVYDKVLHTVAYGLLSVLLFFGISGSQRMRALCSIGAIAALGALDEGIQSMLPYRHANFHDWKFNMLGAIASVGLLSSWYSLRMRASRKPGSSKPGT
ncbi:VanZ family protein [Noviherbaspirillum massiliense]|uniref:VanZ family protein n=1 Tax=Noviherbaspirillum massiliense TaxID=1465823 RepID=UPI00036D23E3|nr:VanZ family protein [Noviherbaspirillum massiliense]